MLCLDLWGRIVFPGLFHYFGLGIAILNASEVAGGQIGEIPDVLNLVVNSVGGTQVMRELFARWGRGFGAENAGKIAREAGVVTDAHV